MHITVMIVTHNQNKTVVQQDIFRYKFYGFVESFSRIH